MYFNSEVAPTMYIVSQIIVPVIIVTPVTTVDCRLSSTELFIIY